MSTKLFPDTPTISLAGTVRFDSPNNHSEVALSAAMEAAIYSQQALSLAASAVNVSVTAPQANSNFLIIDTPRNIRYRVNGGTEDFTVARLFLGFGVDITSLEFFNDQLDPAEDVTVSLSWGMNDGTIV